MNVLAAVTVGYSAEGKQRRVTVYGKTKDEALEKKKKIERDGVSALPVASGQTLGAYLEHWLKNVAGPRVRLNTIDRYEHLIRLHVCPLIGGIRLERLTSQNVEHFYADMQRTGRTDWTRHMVAKVLHNAIGDAVGLHRPLRMNPCEGVVKPRQPQGEMSYYSDIEIEAFLKEAAKHRLYALFILAIVTGMREGELFGLLWSDVHFESGSLTIRHGLTQAKGKFSNGPPKSKAGQRRIKLPSFAVDALQIHRKAMLAEGHCKPDGPVFCNSRGSWLHKSNFLRRAYHPMQRRAGLPEIRFHDLRHSSATVGLLMGENPKVLSERLGHSTTRLAQDRYSHVMDTMQQDTADKFQHRFGQPEGERRKAT